MKLNISKFKSVGNLEDERVIISVAEDLNVGNHLLSKGKSITSGDTPLIDDQLEDTYWFPDIDVAENDSIIVYTKAGQDRNFKNKGGHTTYVMYMGKSSPIWTLTEAAAVLMEVLTWTFVSVSDVEIETEAASSEA